MPRKHTKISRFGIPEPDLGLCGCGDESSNGTCDACYGISVLMYLLQPILLRDIPKVDGSVETTEANVEPR